MPIGRFIFRFVFKLILLSPDGVTLLARRDDGRGVPDGGVHQEGPQSGGELCAREEEARDAVVQVLRAAQIGSHRNICMCLCICVNICIFVCISRLLYMY